MPDKPDLRTVTAEEQDLRARLEKAEESLREILSGEADALFVSGPGGAQLFALKGADQSYRTLIENMSEGALTLTSAGLILYANRRFAGMLRTPLEKVIGSDIHTWFAPENREVLQTLLRNDTADNRRGELALAAADGTQVPVNLSVSHLILDEQPDSFCMVATDLSEQKRSEAFLAAEGLKGAILEQAADAIVICDETGRIIRASKQAQALCDKNPLGQDFEHAFALRKSDGAVFSPIGAIDTNRRQSVEARLEHNAQAFELLVSVGHLRGARAELLGSVITLTDITESKRAAEALRRSELEFRSLAESMPQIVWITRPDGWNIYFNHQWMDYTGLTLEECLGHGWNKPFHPDDQQRAWDAWQKATATNGIYSIESRLRRADGTYRWWLVRGVPLKDAAGNIVKWFGTCTEIHDLKTAELEISRANRELRESEARFRTLTAMSSDFYWESDAEHRLTARASASKKLSMVSVFQRGAQIGEHRWDIPHLSPDAAGWQAHRALLDAHLPFRDFELSRLGADGNERHISVSGDPVFSSSGAFQGYRGVGTDITERKQAEVSRQLRAVELEESQRIARIGSWGWTISTGAITWSDGMNHVLARDRSSPAPTFETLQQFYTAESWQRLGAAIANTIETGAPYDLELAMIRADGSTCWTTTRGEAIRGPDGTVVKLRGTVYDITEHKRSEEEIRGLAKFPGENPNAVLRIARDGTILYANESSAPVLTTWGREVGQNVPDDWQKWIAEAHKSGIGKEMEIECNRRIFSCSLTPIRAEEYVNIYGREVTANKEAERKIRRLNRVNAVLNGINTLIVRVSDRDELFKEACRIAVETGGFRMALIGIVDRSAKRIVPVGTAGVDDEFLTALKDRFSLLDGPSLGNTIPAKAIREKRIIVVNDVRSNPEILFGRKYVESGVRSMAVLPLVVTDEAVGMLVLYASEPAFFHEDEMKLLTELTGDIAFAIDHIGKQERLDYLAYYDELTGLANRSLFLDRVTQYMRSAASGGHKLAVFLIDLDRFRNINDSLGRPAGDALLRQVADWLRLDSGDASLVARLDADHFATVLPVIKQDGHGAQLLEKTIEAFMNHPFHLNDAVFRIAVKVGVAVFPDDGADADTLFRNAETALKRAKASGERYLFYAQTMNAAVSGKLTLENQLRNALDSEEFVLHYQPKVNLVSGKLTSAEALIRWNDPRTGLVPPGRFIPILEETGLIYDVGRWALRQAIADYLRWRAAGLPAVRIAVNVSALQLRNRGFIEEIRQVIGVDPQAPGGLELEITESLIMEDVKGTIASLQAIRDLGVSIAIDDFGTGFSSLSYLAKLPVDTLKIDRSFVIEMTAGPEGLALVSTIINLAHSLKLKVVAEGVETEEQSSLLRLLSCDEMQGFLFSKPVPVDIFETRFLAVPSADGAVR